MTAVPPVFRHIEDHLGTIDPSAGYWNFPIGNGIQVVAFRNKPRVGAITLCTIGLGGIELCSPAGHVRQELVLAFEDRFPSERLACLFPCVCEWVFANRVALSKGQLLGPFGSILADSPLEALVCMPPLPFSPSFEVCEQTSPPTHFVWLVPISLAEGDEVWNGQLAGLERRWQEKEADLLNWLRPV